MFLAASLRTLSKDIEGLLSDLYDMEFSTIISWIVIGVIIYGVFCFIGSLVEDAGSYIADESTSSDALEDFELKDCPMCGEEIKAVATKCKHCKSSI